MLGMPMFFAGGAHDKADFDQIVGAVTESALEMKRNGFPFDLAWPDQPAWTAEQAAEWTSA